MTGRSSVASGFLQYADSAAVCGVCRSVLAAGSPTPCRTNCSTTFVNNCILSGGGLPPSLPVPAAPLAAPPSAFANLAASAPVSH